MRTTSVSGSHWDASGIPDRSVLPIVALCVGGPPLLRFLAAKGKLR